jgi:hypothetical protein
MTEVTRLLEAANRGDKQAAAKLAQEQPGQTLDATALVHEASLRLVGPRRDEPGGSRGDEPGGLAGDKP